MARTPSPLHAKRVSKPTGIAQAAARVAESAAAARASRIMFVTTRLSMLTVPACLALLR